MTFDHYAISTSTTSFVYSFTSTGKNGDTQNLIQYSLVQDYPAANLGFGKLLDDGTIDDFHITDNGDTEKILATVARTVVHFTDNYPHIPVLARGSTPERNRLYRRMINKHYAEITKDFDIYGWYGPYNEGDTPVFQDFRPNEYANAYLVKRIFRDTFTKNLEHNPNDEKEN